MTSLKQNVVILYDTLQEPVALAMRDEKSGKNIFFSLKEMSLDEVGELLEDLATDKVLPKKT
mgnify:CR=1 FL=1